jgi:hypothetical protein
VCNLVIFTVPSLPEVKIQEEYNFPAGVGGGGGGVTDTVRSNVMSGAGGQEAARVCQGEARADRPAGPLQEL